MNSNDLHMHVRYLKEPEAQRLLGSVPIGIENCYVISGEDLGECEMAIVNVAHCAVLWSNPSPLEPWFARRLVDAVAMFIELDKRFCALYEGVETCSECGRMLLKSPSCEMGHAEGCPIVNG